MEPRKNKKWKLKSIFLNDFGACNRILYIYLFIYFWKYIVMSQTTFTNMLRKCACVAVEENGKNCVTSSLCPDNGNELNFRSSALINGKGYITSFLHDVDL